jgi:thiamine pyrophosphokinase
MQRYLVFVNEPFVNRNNIAREVRADDIIVCADAGAHLALNLGLRPHYVVGDFDSLAPETLMKLKELGVPLDQHPAMKDETDLELALKWVRQQPPGIIVLIGAFGGRIDQSLGNLFCLLTAELEAFKLEIYDGQTRGYLLRSKESCSITGRPNETVSLIPISQAVSGVTTSGLVWPLTQSTLQFGRSLSISNKLSTPQASVSIETGMLLALHIEQD